MRLSKTKLALSLLLLGISVKAENITVELESNGILTASGLSPGSTYTLEWASNLSRPFTNEAPIFKGIVDSSNGTIQIEIPMFFRIVESSPEGMAAILSGSINGTNPLGSGEFYDMYYTNNYSLAVSAFYMDATEITKAEWDTVYSWAVTNGYSFDNAGLGKADNHPVHTINWYDCVKWCNARSEKEGRIPYYTVGGDTYKAGNSLPDCNVTANGYCLPTSDEWEYATRGGLDSKRFPWGDTISYDDANYSGLNFDYETNATTGYHPTYTVGSAPYTSPVGVFQPNEYGLYDMSGNVWEWCWDTIYYEWAPSTPYQKVRGGSWYTYAYQARCGHVDFLSPDYEDYAHGFRTVCH